VATSPIQQAYAVAPLEEPIEPPMLAPLLDDLTAAFRRFVVFHPVAAEPVSHLYSVVALWAAHTHVFQAFETTPYLHIFSPTKGSGKTLLLEVLAEVVAAPWMFASVTAAALTRRIDGEHPTVLYDEVDALDKETGDILRGIFNSGYKASGQRTVARAVGSAVTWDNLSTFCPKAFSGIGSGALWETVKDRSLTVAMKKKTKSERVERGRRRYLMLAFHPLRDSLTKWAQQAPIREQLAQAEPLLPDQLSDREQDCVEPLVAIADMAGGHWPETVRAAAIAMSAARVEDPGLNELLLGDIRGVFSDHEKAQAGPKNIFTVALLQALNTKEERPWGHISRSGLGLTTQGLAGRLKDFKIIPHSIRAGPETGKGYRREDFADAWARYLPALEGGTTSHNVTTPSLPSAEQIDSVTPEPSENPGSRPLPASDGVTAEAAPQGADEVTKRYSPIREES